MKYAYEEKQQPPKLQCATFVIVSAFLYFRGHGEVKFSSNFFLFFPIYHAQSNYKYVQFYFYYLSEE